MAEERFEIPLFPLNVVLFPGMALPLHVFEPRYQRMTASCLEDRAPFGVVLARSEESQPGHDAPARVGTLARIADYARLPDGRYNLLALGTRRFEVVEVRHSRPYLTGLVQPLRDCDEDCTPPRKLLDEAKAELREYLRTVLALVGSEERRFEIPDEGEDLSFLIGMCLSCEDCEKQDLLEMTSTAARLRAGLRMLRKEREVLERQIETSKRKSSRENRAIFN